MKNNLLPLILAVALFMESMDTNVIATSLPNIAQALNTDPITLKLAMTSYLVALAIFIPISGWLADRFTARRVFRYALCLFMIGSIFCALSFSLFFFIFSRFLQGVGGAMMTPISRLLLLRLVPKEQRLSALTWLTIPASIGPLLGPPIGGFITSYWSWHWIFLINIPIGMLGLIYASIFLPKNEIYIYRSLDWKGFIYSSIGLSCFILGLSMLNMQSISQISSIILTLTGLVLCAFYVLHANKTEYPLLNIRLFKEEIFRKTILASSIFRLAVGSISFLLPLMLQLGFHFSPLHAGCITFISAAGVLLLKFNAQSIYNFYGFRKTLIWGTGLSIIFTAINGLFTPFTPYWLLLSCLFIGGFLRALCLSGANSFAFENINKTQMSDATPLFAVLQQTSIALSVSLSGIILEWRQQAHGNMLELEDFHIAFFILSLIAFGALYAFNTLPKAENKASHKKREKLNSS